MSELTVMGGSPSHRGPRKMDPEEAPTHGATPRHQWGFFPLSVPTRNRQERVRFISRNVAEVRPDRRTVWSLDAPHRDSDWRVHRSLAKWLLPIPIQALPHTLRGDYPEMRAGLRKATASLQDVSPEPRRADGYTMMAAATLPHPSEM